MSDVLTKLARVLEQRKSADTGDSYVSGLYAKGLNKILEKVGEEATETILAAKECQGQKETEHQLIHETADLWFHTLVMLSYLDLQPEQVLEELEKRFKISGLAEKASTGLVHSGQAPTGCWFWRFDMGLGGIGIWQLLIILLIVFMLFGTKKLRNLGSDLGGALKGFKTAMKDEVPGSV